MVRSAILAPALLLCMGIFAGCATTNQKSALSPAGSRGEVLLTINGNAWQAPEDKVAPRILRSLDPLSHRSRKQLVDPQTVTVVSVKNDRGATISEKVVPVYSGDIVMDVLKRELAAAGFTVRLVRELPGNVTKGIDVSSVSAELEESSGLLTTQGSCNLSFRLDMWRNGSRVGSHDYESMASDYALSGERQLFTELMTKAAQSAMKQAVPDMVGVMSVSDR